MGVAADLVGRVCWCFAVGVPAPRHIVCDKPSFCTQQLLAWWCRRCLAMCGTKHEVM